MMGNSFSNQGLLGTKRGESWWRHSGVRAGLCVAAILVVGGGLFAGLGDDDGDDEGPPPAKLAVASAGGNVAASLESARAALDGERAEKIMRERREQQARQARWEPGESMLLIGELEADQSVYVAMTDRGIPDGTVHRVLEATGEEFDFGRSRAGDLWRAEVDAEGRVEKFRYETSPEDVWVTRYDEENDEYVAEQKEVELDVRHKRLAGEVDGSFWLSITSGGESDILAHRFMEVFRFNIDFNTESRNGDRYAMVVEEMYLDGEFLRYGKVLAAVYLGDRGPIQAYYFEGDEEHTGYYDEDGESLERQFLRSPLEVTRVTSQFGRREHPITGDQKMHTGVDYGAPTGTPVQAVADGTVVYAGWNGGYGNMLKIRHAGGYQTRYAHLSGFESGVSAGTRISQGEIVARSGNTGASTAPHLHYEMLKNGRHIDPLGVDADSGEPLDESLVAEFQNEIVDPRSDQLHAALAGESPEAAEALAETVGD